MEYRPVRIIKLVQIHNTSARFLQDNYPHALIQRSGKTFKAFYKPGTVVNAPNETERKLFDAIKGAFAEIPQLPKVGGDDPMSGLARSHKSAKKSEQKFIREVGSIKSESINKKETPEVNNNE